MLCSYVYKFINFSVAILQYIATCLKAERRASLCLHRNTPRSGATQGTMSVFGFIHFFKTKSDICVATDRTCKRFFYGKLNLARSKDGGLRGTWHCCSFNAPSTYASVAW
jgi:hypothetical protein